MEEIKSLQLLKEQLRQKTRDLQKRERERDQVSEKLSNVLALNQTKMTEMQAIINQKNEEVKHHQQEAWAARMSKHVGIEQQKEAAPAAFGSEELEEKEKAFRTKLDDMKKKNQELMQRVLKETGEKDKLTAERSILIKELKRVRTDTEDSDKLKKEVAKMQEELAKVKNRAGDSNIDYKQLLKEKEDMIASYEKMLYGNITPDQEGMLPQEIIHELRLEIENLEEERKKMVIDMEQLEDLNNELEMKVATSGDKDATQILGAGAGHGETSLGQAAEFHTGLERFLVSYADMMTLLLALFVLLYSFSKIDTNKLSVALSSFQDKQVRLESTNMRLSMDEVKMLDRVRELVKDNVDPESLVRSDVKTVLVRLSTADLFAPGNADLIDGAQHLILRELAGKIDEGVKQVLIDGHTDDVPIKSDKFPSNWELSSARASRVARVLIDSFNFPADRLVVAGYGQFRPLKPNTSDQNRAINRRVEIKIMTDMTVLKEEENKRNRTKGDKGKSAPAKPAAPSTAALAPR
jgi:chemotaxis protein MotB